ncbi:MAG TPA: hypothetical protein VFC79_05955 [Tissierellaceae bacterium]|nr:hypothetical protein [Tissierellaceae bacterium]
MATPYYEVDQRFLNKITDDLLLTMSEEGLEKTIYMYRNSAEVRFKKCEKLSTKNEEEKQYDTELTNEELEILSSYMVIEWLRQRINNIRLLKQGMSTKDYTIYSQANHLDTLIKLRKDTEQEVDRMLISYTYSENDLSALGKV